MPLSCTESQLLGCSGDGANPYAGVIMDASGNLYGTTAGGGTGSCSTMGFSGCGTVFELPPIPITGTTTTSKSSRNPATAGDSAVFAATVSRNHEHMI